MQSGAEIEFADFVSRLKNELPVFEQLMRRECSYYGDEEPGAFVVIGDLFPEVLRRIERDEEEASTFGHFLERMARSKDERVQDLFQIEVTRVLLENRNALARLRPSFSDVTVDKLNLTAAAAGYPAI